MNYFFNPSNKLLERIELYKTDSILIFRIVLHYNDIIKLTDELWYFSDGRIMRKITHKYDSSGREIGTEECCNNQGEISSKEIYKYDSSGNRIEINKYDSDGTLSYKKLFKNDYFGNRIEDKMIILDSIVRYKHEYIYSK